MSWVKLEHALNKVFKFITEESLSFSLILAMSFPENVSSISSQTSIERISWLGSGEWWMLSDHNE
jgi:hypothetical protein